MQFVSQVKVNGVWRTIIEASTQRPYRFTTREEAEKFRPPGFHFWKVINDGNKEPKVRGLLQPHDDA